MNLESYPQQTKVVALKFWFLKTLRCRFLSLSFGGPFLFVALLAALPAHARVMSFREWKSHRVSEARATLHQIEVRGLKSDSAKNRWRQAKLNLEIARDLSANDYFLLYVNENYGSNKQALTEAVKGLAPAEVADIFQHYHETLSQENQKYTRIEALAPSQRVPAKSGGSREPRDIWVRD